MTSSATARCVRRRSPSVISSRPLQSWPAEVATWSRDASYPKVPPSPRRGSCCRKWANSVRRRWRQVSERERERESRRLLRTLPLPPRAPFIYLYGWVFYCSRYLWVHFTSCCTLKKKSGGCGRMCYEMSTALPNHRTATQTLIHKHSKVQFTVRL